MTNEEAIETLRANYPDVCFGQLREAVDMAIKALTAQDDSKELSFTHKALDTVSRQAVIEAINKIFPADPMRDDYTQGITCGAALANIYVGQLPSAQPDLEEAYICGETEAEARFYDEIVRCKDCKYWMPHSQLGFDEDNGTYHDYCAKLVPEDEYYAFYRNADDYCSRAERRTDDCV